MPNEFAIQRHSTMTIRIPQLLVLLACSSAAALTLTQEKHLAKPNVRSLTRLRGGDTIGTAVVGASAAIGAATGVSMYLGTESITKMIWLGAFPRHCERVKPQRTAATHQRCCSHAFASPLRHEQRALPQASTLSRTTSTLRSP